MQKNVILETFRLAKLWKIMQNIIFCVLLIFVQAWIK
jgi:hypothetical protein